MLRGLIRQQLPIQVRQLALQVRHGGAVLRVLCPAAKAEVLEWGGAVRGEAQDVASGLAHLALQCVRVCVMFVFICMRTYVHMPIDLMQSITLMQVIGNKPVSASYAQKHGLHTSVNQFTHPHEIHVLHTVVGMCTCQHLPQHHAQCIHICVHKEGEGSRGWWGVLHHEHMPLAYIKPALMVRGSYNNLQ